MKGYVLDNGGQWTHLEYKMLQNLGADVRIVPNTVSFERIKDADFLVFSGGAPSIATEIYKLGNLGEILDRFEGPVLGICVGHQFIAVHFGGSAGRADTPEYGPVEIEIVREDDIFCGFPRKILVWESHNDEVKSAPAFEILAKSKYCPIQAIKHKEKPIYGVQFHPEVKHTQMGRELFANFLSLVKV